MAVIEEGGIYCVIEKKEREKAAKGKDEGKNS